MGSKLYRPLNDAIDEFRLLIFCPPDKGSSQIRLWLRPVSLRDKPLYHALSYVWGTEPTTHPISINGETVMVRPNLYFALCRFKQLRAFFVVWCDALCINQEDIDERNHQVMRMGDIYSNAYRVVIWLGKEDSHTEMAFGHLDFLANIMWDLDHLRGAYDGEFKGLSPAIRAKLRHPHGWRALKNLFIRQWWRRIWVVQEALLTEDALLVCGRYECSWRTCMTANYVMRKLLRFSELRCYPGDQVDMMASVYESNFTASSIMELSGLVERHSSISATQVLLSMSDFLASDPRDKLYGILGLIKLISDKPFNVTVNYGNPVHRVYSDLVLAYLKDHGRLSIIGSAGVGWKPKHPSLNLPSWVPDLRNIHVDSSNPKKYSGVGAAGQTDAVATLSAESHILSAHGLLCGVVQSSRLGEGLKVSNFSEWRKFVSPYGNSPHPTGIPYLQAYFRTVIKDVRNFFSANDFLDSSELYEFYNLAAGFLYAISHLEIERIATKHESSKETQAVYDLNEYEMYFAVFSASKEEIYRSIIENDILKPFLGPRDSEVHLNWALCPHNSSVYSEYASKLDFEALRNLNNSSIFALDDGYFGIGPPETKRGDRLCILLGCEYPLLIRPQGKHYILVGACYVYGAMRGEFMDDIKSGKRHIENGGIALIIDEAAILPLLF